MSLVEISFDKMFKESKIDAEIFIEEISRVAQIPVDVLKLFTHVTSLTFDLTLKQKNILSILTKAVKIRNLEAIGKTNELMSCGFTPNKIYLNNSYQMIIVADIIIDDLFLWFIEKDAKELFKTIIQAEVEDVTIQ